MRRQKAPGTSSLRSMSRKAACPRHLARLCWELLGRPRGGGACTAGTMESRSELLSLEPISKLAHEDESTGEVKKPEEVLGLALVAGN